APLENDRSGKSDAPGFRERSCSIKKLDHDSISTRSHHGLAALRLTEVDDAGLAVFRSERQHAARRIPGERRDGPAAGPLCQYFRPVLDTHQHDHAVVVAGCGDVLAGMTCHGHDTPV